MKTIAVIGEKKSGVNIESLIHNLVAEKFGALPGLRDINGLKSAL